MSPALNGSSAIRRFKRSNAIEIRDVITFDFYTGLPHMLISKTARKYALNIQYANERQKLTTPPKPRRHVYMTAYSAGKKNQKALHVDLLLTVGSSKSVSCDAMTNVGSCLEENS